MHTGDATTVLRNWVKADIVQICMFIGLGTIDLENG